MQAGGRLVIAIDGKAVRGAKDKDGRFPRTEPRQIIGGLESHITGTTTALTLGSPHGPAIRPHGIPI